MSCNGNLPTCRRGKREAVFKEVCEKVTSMFGEFSGQAHAQHQMHGTCSCGQVCCLWLLYCHAHSAVRRLHCTLAANPSALPLGGLRLLTLCCFPLLSSPGDKYVVRLVEDPEAMLDEAMMGGGGGGDGAAPEPRVQFEILPQSSAQPAPVKGWQRVAAGVLLLLTLGSTLQFGLAANIGLLPKVRVGGGCEHGAQVVQVLWCCAAALRTLACMQGLLVQQCCLFLLGSLLAQEPYSAALRTVWRSG